MGQRRRLARNWPSHVRNQSRSVTSAPSARRTVERSSQSDDQHFSANVRYPIVLSLGLLSTAVFVSTADSGLSDPAFPVQVPAPSALDPIEEQDPRLLAI